MTTQEAYKVIQSLGKTISEQSEIKSKAITIAGLSFVIKYKTEMPGEVLQAHEIVKEDIANYIYTKNK